MQFCTCSKYFINWLTNPGEFQASGGMSALENEVLYLSTMWVQNEQQLCELPHAQASLASSWLDSDLTYTRCKSAVMPLKLMEPHRYNTAGSEFRIRLHRLNSEDSGSFAELRTTDCTTVFLRSPQQFDNVALSVRFH